MQYWDQVAEKWTVVKVTEVNIQKSSQSGFSEACLNGVRWKVSFRPVNVIYAIDSAEEAKKIARRLLRSFKFLDQSIYTGDPDDIKSLEFNLRGMELLFYGSFSTGKFANKQSPFTISDEVEEHGKFILHDLSSRKKTSKGGLQINLSKPKLKGGPINRAYERGNQEAFYVPCPHCEMMQPITFFAEERETAFSDTMEEIKDEQTGKVLARLPRPLPLGQKRSVKTGRMVFDHCRNLLGKWDRLRVLRETYFECAGCQLPIHEDRKRWMIDRGEWMPTVVDGSPGSVSQQMSDLYSEDELSSWGAIALAFIDAKHESIEALQAFYNHRLGKVWAEEANATAASDIVLNMAGRGIWLVDAPNTEGQMVRHIFTEEASADRLVASEQAVGRQAKVVHSACAPYKRGTLPFDPAALVLGSDVGGNYARWATLALHKNLSDVAVIDWGEELDPDSIRWLMANKTWATRDGVKHRIKNGWMDARWRTKDVYSACLATRGALIPTKGLGGAAALNVKLWVSVHVATYPDRFKELHYNDQRAKDAMYLEMIKRMWRRMWFPIDVEEDETFVEELCAERQKQDRRGQWFWSEKPEGPNHYGDAVKEGILGINFLLRKMRPQTA